MTKLNLLTYPLVAILSLAAAGAALADDITPDNTATVSLGAPKTRLQVRDELAAARADGSIQVYSMRYNPFAKLARNTDPRVAERAADHAATYYGEDSGSFALSRTPKTGVVAQPLYAGVKR